MNASTAHKSTEHTVNTALAEVLRGFGREWDIHPEDIGIMEDRGRPDVVIKRPDGHPLVIEAEVDNPHQAEKEAVGRIGKVVTGGWQVQAAVALSYPADIRRHSDSGLRDALRSTDLVYALMMRDSEGGLDRLPPKGYLQGRARDLAALIHRVGAPASLVDRLALELERAVVNAVAALTHMHSYTSSTVKTLMHLMIPQNNGHGEAEDADEEKVVQTLRMAMAAVANALVFHGILSESGMRVDYDRRKVHSPEHFRIRDVFSPGKVCDEWDLILEVNYWPIFRIARDIIKELSTRPAARIIGILWEVSERMIAEGAARSHDLTGMVFQRLIIDRQFLAAYYTKPSSSALLAGLALPRDSIDWSDAKSLKGMRIGDFSCGTGTLLSTAYRRFGMLHELAGGEPGDLHPKMMEDGLVGLDILNIAVHLTSSMLAGTYPDRVFKGECLLTMPYGEYMHQKGRKGRRDIKAFSVGSLELLSEPEVTDKVGDMFGAVRAAAKTAGGKGERDVKDYMDKLRHGVFDIVAMNPPFTRATSIEGEAKEKGKSNPAMAALGTTPEEWEQMAVRLKKLAKEGAADGNAGLASYFIELAHRKLKDRGVLALVLPLTALSGPSWEKCRRLWRRDYGGMTVVTAADGGSFSADTAIAECVVVCQKEAGDGGAHFAVLDTPPKSAIEGEMLADAIEQARDAGCRRLESGAFSGTPLMLGESKVGEMLSCRLPKKGPWGIASIQCLPLAQSAYRLGEGVLQFDDRMEPVEIPVCQIKNLCKVTDKGKHCIGPVHRDLATNMEGSAKAINAAKNASGVYRAPFAKMGGTAETWPMLWAHNVKQERRMTLVPDSHGIVHNEPSDCSDDYTRKARYLWDNYAGRIHYSLDIGMSAQSLIVAFLEKPAFGGRAWPSVVLGDEKHEAVFALWCNSCMGILQHWWTSTRTQGGRCCHSVTTVGSIPALDTRKLSKVQLKTAAAAFETLREQKLLPLNQLDEDPVRAEIDRVLLQDVLGLQDAASHVGRLRSMLSAERSIHGNKRTRVRFTPDGKEETVPTNLVLAEQD